MGLIMPLAYEAGKCLFFAVAVSGIYRLFKTDSNRTSAKETK